MRYSKIYEQAIGKTVMVLQWGCLAVANWFTLAFLYVACCTFFYPFNLEWMEGQTIDVVQRVMNGLPVYTKPHIDYVPYLYTPLYFYVSALVAKVTGVSFFPTRLVSTLSTLGVGVIICLWVCRETQTAEKKGDWEAGLVGAGLFFATYRLSGRWFDNSRVDSLALFFAFLCLYIFTFYRGHKNAVIAAAAGAAAFFTKQTALIMVLPVVAVGLLQYTRDALVMGLVLAILVGGGILLANYMTDGWFNFFVFDIPASHSLDQNTYWRFWTADINPHLGILLVITALMPLLLAIDNWKTGLWYAAFAAGGIAAAYIPRLHSYGWVNVLMPAHAALALMSGLAMAYVRQIGFSKIIGVLSVILLWQMKGLLYDPKPLIPDQKSVEAGQHFVQELAKIPGDVFMPELQYVPTMAGKKSYALGMAAADLGRAKFTDKEHIRIKEEFEQEMVDVVSSGQFLAVMPGRMVGVPGLQQYYSSYKELGYPKEYVSGAINFLKTRIYLRIPDR